MNVISRKGFLLIDLDRSWIAVWVTKWYTRMVTRNIMTRTDSHLSVLRGFTASELKTLSLAAGVRDVSIRRCPFFRLLLIGRKPSSTRV
jgi:hypothetical protein